MKKLITMSLIALPVLACNAEQNTTSLTILAQAVSTADAVELPKYDNDNTKYYQVPATNELLAIYNGEKNAMFNVGDNAFANTTGKCVINVWSDTDYRIFCGTREDVTPGKFWAVSTAQ